MHVQAIFPSRTSRNFYHAFPTPPNPVRFVRFVRFVNPPNPVKFVNFVNPQPCHICNFSHIYSTTYGKVERPAKLPARLSIHLITTRQVGQVLVTQKTCEAHLPTCQRQRRKAKASPKGGVSVGVSVGQVGACLVEGSDWKDCCLRLSTATFGKGCSGGYPNLNRAVLLIRPPA